MLLALALGIVACVDLSPYQGPYQILDTNEGHAIAVDASRVYWATYDGVRTAPLSGAGHSTTLAEIKQQGLVSGLIADETHLFWLREKYTDAEDASTWALERMAKKGGTPEALDVTALLPCGFDTTFNGGMQGFRPQSLAADDTHIFFPARESSDPDEPCRIHRIAKSGVDPHELVGEPPATEKPSSLALGVDESTVYWLGSLSEVPSPAVRLYKKDKAVAGGAFSQVCDVDSNTTSMALDQTTVWLATSDGVLKVDKNGQTPEDVSRKNANEGNWAASLALSDTHVFWVVPRWRGSDDANAVLYRAPKAGGDAKRLMTVDLSAPSATFQDSFVWSIVVKGDWVYSAAQMSDELGGPKGVFKVPAGD
jgi:hypothetical protein